MTQTGTDSAALSVLSGLAEPALRALALAVVAGLPLTLLRVRRTAVKLCVWTTMLAAALAMPALDLVVPALPLRVLPAAMSESALAVQNDRPGLPTGEAAVQPGGAGLKTRPSIGTNEARSLRDGAPRPLHDGELGLLQDGGQGLQTLPQPSLSSPAQASIPISWPLALLLVYLLGVLVLLARAVVGWIATRRFRRAAETINDSSVIGRLNALVSDAGLARSPRLAESAAGIVPLTMGIVRPVIVLPLEWREWSEATLNAVLIHELAHVARRDALTQSLSLLHRAVFWFSPLGWWLRRHLVQLAEYASDEAVLAGGVDQATYAVALLGFFTALGRDQSRADWSALRASSGHVAMAQGSGPERRIERIFAWTGGRSKLTKAVAVGIALLAVPAVAVVAAIRPMTMAIPLPPVRQMETFVGADPTGVRGRLDQAIPREQPGALGTINRVSSQAESRQQAAPKTGTDAWRADRAAMFQQLMQRAQQTLDDINSMLQIGTLASFDKAGHDKTLRALKDALDAESQVTVVATPSASEIAAIKVRFAKAIKDFEMVENKFNVGLSTTKEVDDALMAAAAALGESRGRDQEASANSSIGAHPSFAGAWRLMPAGTDNPGAPPLGETCTIAQGDDSLAVDWSFMGSAGRGAGGAMIERPVHSVFPFDGSESNVSIIVAASGGSRTRIFDVASWAGDTLLVLTHWQSSLPDHVTRRKALWLDSDGTLVVESRVPGERGAPESAITTRYRRVRPAEATPPLDAFLSGAHQVGEAGAVPPQMRTSALPRYTPEAIRQKIQGTVELECIVEPDGTVSRSRVTKSLDATYGLDDQAIDTMSKWTFKPGTVNGRPVRFIVHMSLSFTLR